LSPKLGQRPWNLIVLTLRKMLSPRSKVPRLWYERPVERVRNKSLEAWREVERASGFVNSRGNEHTPCLTMALWTSLGGWGGDASRGKASPPPNEHANQGETTARAGITWILPIVIIASSLLSFALIKILSNLSDYLPLVKTLRYSQPQELFGLNRSRWLRFRSSFPIFREYCWDWFNEVNSALIWKVSFSTFRH